MAVVLNGTNSTGLALAESLTKRFLGHVYVTDHDEKKINQISDEISIRGLKIKSCYFQPHDPTSRRDFANLIIHFTSRIDIFVTKSGAQVDKSKSFAEQAEQMLFDDFYYVLYACRVIFPLLNPNARVVHLSTAAGKIELVPSAELRHKLINPQLTEQELVELLEQYLRDVKSGKDVSKTWGTDVEIVSKTALTALTFIQQRQFDKMGTNIAVNATFPGYTTDDESNGFGQNILRMKQSIRTPMQLALQPITQFPRKGLFVWMDNTIVNKCAA